MRPSTSLRLCLLAACCAVLITRPARAQADTRVDGLSFFANGQLARGFEYTGACPVKLQFHWHVTSPEATSLVYNTVRNDGARSSSPMTAAVTGPNHGAFIRDDWQLGAGVPEFANYHGWVQLEVFQPARATKRINFTLHCTPS
jgi:hypothetical protein